MKNKKLSFYTILGGVLFVIMAFIMSVQVWYDYTNAKSTLENDIKQNATTSLHQLKKTIRPYVDAYSMDEYLNIIQTEMGHENLYAIVVEDYNLGKVLGTKKYVSGKIRDKQWNVIDFDSENSAHKKSLTNQYFKIEDTITDQDTQAIAKVTVYGSDKYMGEKLEKIIVKQIIVSFLIYIVFLAILYFMIRTFILKPISRLISNLSYKDKYNIPKVIQKNKDTKEMYTLTSTLYNMIETINQSRKAQSEQKKELQMIFDYSKDGIFIMDLDSNFLTFNEAYRSMTGYTKEFLLSTSCIELTLPSQREMAEKVIQDVIANGQIENFEKICTIDNEKQITVNMSMALLPDKKRILATVKDMTQAKLLQSQSKLVAMGEMIGNIAHQWRQPLSVVSTAASGAKIQKRMGALSDKEFEKTMDLIVSQTQYLSQTINDFRDFIKNDTSKPKQSFFISEVIDKVSGLISSSLDNNYITLIKNTTTDMKVSGYKSELVQALINIFNNAKDAIKENIDDEDERFIFLSTKKEKDAIAIIITDTGGGVPPELLDRIYEPYFTTKHQSVGTGIGLHMARDIILNHHNGTIEVSNLTFDHEGKTYTGASFKIVLENIE